MSHASTDSPLKLPMQFFSGTRPLETRFTPEQHCFVSAMERVVQSPKQMLLDQVIKSTKEGQQEQDETVNKTDFRDSDDELNTMEVPGLSADKVTNDGNDGEDVEESEDLWSHAIVSKLREDSESKGKLERVLQASQLRDSSEHNLRLEMDKSMGNLEAVLKQGILETLANPFQDDLRRIFETLRMEITGYFQSNFDHRWELQQRLDEYDQHWSHRYHELSARILELPKQQYDSVILQGNEENMDDSPNSENMITTQDKSPSQKSEASDDDVNWDALVSQKDAKSAERVQRFLHGWARLNAAGELYEKVSGEVCDQLKATTMTVLQVAVEAYTPLRDTLDATERDLRDYIMQNSERRAENLRALEQRQLDILRYFEQIRCSLTTGKCKRKRGEREIVMTD